MSQIHIDMFAVELGLSVLLQFENEGSFIRVLADAGSKKYKVNKKLEDTISVADGEKILIDLMIGTHYDGDHLNGLVDIIGNPNIEIGEAWMPPVANDAEPRLLSQEPQDESMLGIQFAGEDGDQILERYLQYKANTCNSACEVEHWFDEFEGIDRSTEASTRLREQNLDRQNFKQDVENYGRDGFFQDHLTDAHTTLGVEKAGHADLEVRSPNVIELDHARRYSAHPRRYLDLQGKLRTDYLDRMPRFSYLEERLDSQMMAHIRISAAKDAINAISLAKVVRALKKRNIKTRYATILDGLPRKFLWDPVDRRFTSTPNSKTSEPSFTLLGPSQGLVKKYWDSLPIGSYAYSSFMKLVPVEEITASNELSYIGVFESLGQRILISGDAGCVDFIPAKGKPFYPKLIEQLDDLQIVQVAHHAGHNAYFYNCLLESDFVQQSTPTYLLLSHGTNDKHRPSSIFNRFIEQLGKDENSIQLLFTSTPREQKVRDLKHLISPHKGPRTPQPNGDVRLSYYDGVWKVLTHYVEVN